jgi:hypothetical protein
MSLQESNRRSSDERTVEHSRSATNCHDSPASLAAEDAPGAHAAERRLRDGAQQIFTRTVILIISRQRA